MTGGNTVVGFDTSELAALSVELGTLGVRATRTISKVYDEAADHLVKAWANNARETSGVHGIHYPDSIDSQRLLSTNIAIEIGPNPSKPQGGMAFETGSVNQPPHPDGQRAGDTEVPLLERRILAALAFLDL